MTPVQRMKQKEELLSHEELLSRVVYDKTTGIFYRNIKGVLIKISVRIMYVKGIPYLASRLAWFYTFGKWPELYLDHINRNTRDNRIANLREASATQNQQNKKINSNSRSGHKGVHIYESKSGTKYRATIRINGKQKGLGVWNDLASAKEAYREAAEEAFGNFARFA